MDSQLSDQQLTSDIARTEGKKASGFVERAEYDVEGGKKVTAGVTSSAPPSPGPTGQLHGWRLYSVQFCLCFSLVLSVVDSSIVATAVITIGKHFDDFAKLQWVVLAYLLTYLGCALIFSRISDVVGRKWATIAALAILLAFSLGAGLSQSLEQVIVFRALQGVGGSGLYAMPFITLPEVTPPEKFGLMSASLGMVFAVSGVLGPTIGGIITTHSTWRWVFYFNVPCCALIIILIQLSWPATQSPGRIALEDLDLLGCLLFVAASVLLVFALQEIGAGTFVWGSPTVVSCLVLAGVAAIALGFWIWFCSKPGRSIAPLFPARIVMDKIIVTNIFITALIGYIFYTVLIELPQRFQVVNGRSSQTAGIDLLPVSGASALGSGLGGFLSSKRNRSFYTLTAGCAFALLGAALVYSIGPSQTIPTRLYGFEILLGFGIGLVFASTTVFIKLYAPLEDAASAQGLIAQSRILGGNIGLAIATVILNKQLVSGLQGRLSQSQISDLVKSLNVIETFTTQEKKAVAQAFESAFITQIEVCAILAGVCLMVCAFTFEKNPPTFERIAAAAKAKAEEQGEDRGAEDQSH